jgi:hypothetical protein
VQSERFKRIILSRGDVVSFGTIAIIISVIILSIFAVNGVFDAWIDHQEDE